MHASSNTVDASVRDIYDDKVESHTCFSRRLFALERTLTCSETVSLSISMQPWSAMDLSSVYILSTRSAESVMMEEPLHDFFLLICTELFITELKVDGKRCALAISVMANFWLFAKAISEFAILRYVWEVARKRSRKEPIDSLFRRVRDDFFLCSEDICQI